jgi:hypothetical protein
MAEHRERLRAQGAAGARHPGQGRAPRPGAGALLVGQPPAAGGRAGVGKTTLAKALARSFAGDFKRVQFTPDLLPTDILGSSVYNPRDGSFSFKDGPIVTHVLLADEINRPRRAPSRRCSRR